MKRLSVLLGLLVLVSCGGSETASGCDQDFWDGTYGTCLPKGWMIVDDVTLRQRGVPDETIAAFRREESVSGQFPSITITREALTKEIEAPDYSEASIRAVSALPGYTLLSTDEGQIDGNDVSLHKFTAQPVEGEPARRFYQVSTVSDGIGFSVTASVPLFVEDKLEAEVLTILKRSTFAEPEEE